MKLLEHTINLPTWGTPWALTPLGCLHADDEGFDEDLFLETRDRIAREPYHYWVGVGDYFSLARGHYRNYLKAYIQDEDSQRDLDALVRTRTKEFYKKYFAPIQDRCWGLAEGNHHWEYKDGGTNTQELCRLMDVPYLEKGSLHRIRLQHPTKGGGRVLKMLVHHGDWGGGGSTTGGDINSAERRGEAWEVDILIFGHTHRKQHWTVPIMTIPALGALRILERTRVFIRAGSFTKGYLTGCITYVERKLMKPNALGAVTMRCWLTQPRDRQRILHEAKSARANTRHQSSPTGNYLVRYRLES